MGFFSSLTKSLVNPLEGIAKAAGGGLKDLGGSLGISADSFTGKAQRQAGSTAASRLRGLAETAGAELDPFIGTATKANTALERALGLGGEEFDPSFIFNTPQFKARLEGATEGLGAAQSRLGLVDSSSTRNKIASQGALLAGDAFQSFIDNLTNIIGRGQQAATAKAGLTTGLQESAIETELAGTLGQAERKNQNLATGIDLLKTGLKLA